jgi:superfamily II DNA or RNA helicase
MPRFVPQDEVELINNPATRGLIHSVIPSADGNTYYAVRYTEGGTGLHTHDETDLQPVEGDLDPWVNLEKGRFYTYEDYALNAVLHKIENTVENSISGLKASKTLFKPHQFIPLVKFLRSDHRRILIADEVGLGKTIEAGHILQELFARKEISRVLVVCTKTLGDKWQTEMNEKFAFPFEELESDDLMKAFSGDLPPEHFFGIINYNKFGANKKLAALAKKHRFQFDLIILDEVQMIRNHQTNMYKALDPMIQDAGAIVFLSATPINNKLEDLYNLLRLLDPRRYLDSRNFENDQAVNRPIVQALNRLATADSLTEIAQDLKSAQVERQFVYGDLRHREVHSLQDLMKDVPLFDRVLKRLESGENSSENRILIQRDMADLNTMSNLLTRTRKRDVEERSPIRMPKKLHVNLSDQERDVFEMVEEELIEQYAKENEFGEIIPNRSIGFLQKARQLASSLHASQDLNPNLISDTKFTEFKKVVNEVVVRSGRKLVVFAEFKKTLKYLESRLKADGFRPVLITGDNAKERPMLLRKFREDPEMQILLASKVGTEGIDLQFCDALVNYDLPWNPMIVEQRIGRLDRIGQKSEMIHLYNLITTDSVEEDVYDRLLNKIHIFESSIGALEVILSTDESEERDIEKLERTLYGKRLTKEQRRHLIDQKARAMINQRENLEAIEKELTDAMVQDMYFRNEIDRIVRNERYLTATDVRGFVLGYIHNKFPQINVQNDSKVGSTSLTLSIPAFVRPLVIQSIRDVIQSSVPAQRMHMNVLTKDLLVALYQDGNISLEFDQEVAFEHPDRLFISAFHPLVVAGVQYFKSIGLERYNAFYLAIENKYLSDVELETGSYLLGVNELEVTRHWQGRSKIHRISIPIAIDLNGNTFAALDQNTSDGLWKESNRMSASYPDAEAVPSEFIVPWRSSLVDALVKRRNELLEEETIRLESSRQQELVRLKEHFDWQIGSREKAMIDMENKLTVLSTLAPSKEVQGFRLVIQNLKTEIQKLKHDYDIRTAAAEVSKATVHMRTLMISLVEIL